MNLGPSFSPHILDYIVFSHFSSSFLMLQGGPNHVCLHAIMKFVFSVGVIQIKDPENPIVVGNMQKSTGVAEADM